jgi:hypothetical protein
MPQLTVTWTEDPLNLGQVEYLVFDQTTFGGPTPALVEGTAAMVSPLAIPLPDEVPPTLTLVLLSPDNTFWRQETIDAVSGEDKEHHLGPLCPERRYVT